MTTGLYKTMGSEPAEIRDNATMMLAYGELKHGNGKYALPDRFRDAYFAKDDQDVPHIVVLTRTGGANREEYWASNNVMAGHPWYVRDVDDEYDSTYAHFWFKVPEPLLPRVYNLMAKHPPFKSLKGKGGRTTGADKAGGEARPKRRGSRYSGPTKS